MKALIFAAGMASRLRPLTDTMPKCLLKVGERCLLHRTISAVISAGIDDVTIVVGYRGNQIKDFVKNNFPELSVSFIDNDKYQTTNNIYSLWLTQARNQNVILLDSDILFDPKIVKALIDTKEKNVLAVNRHELGEEEIKVITDKNGNVCEISKTCSIKDALGESVGIELMSAEYTSVLFDELKQMIENEGEDNVFYEKAFERIIAKGQTFKILDTTNFFSIELDTVSDFEQAKQLIPPYLF